MNLGKKLQGKVRDYYIAGDKRIIISTDRISAFDKILGEIPQRGQILNQLSEFWFDKTSDIIENHKISVPHPSVMIVKNAKLIPIEMVVRGYITGVTGTSIWGSYEKGERNIYGIKFPEGLKKNQKLKTSVITPTTKAEKGHDERLTRSEIIKRNLVPEDIYKQMEKASLKLFERGQKIADKAGLILVDTKYEFGIINNKLILIDEIHTPDSSRFWIKRTYLERFKKGLEPENFDKEFLRLWFAERGYKGEGKPPKMTEDFIKQVRDRYISIYEKLTGEKFTPSKEKINEKKILNTLDNNSKITYEQVGDNYETKDPIKKLFQDSARNTGKNLVNKGFSEVSESRGESAYVWKQGNVYMASVIEGLGTKNLIADGARDKTKTYYDVVAHDTVATIINDLITVGANPLVLHAYWAIEDNSWLYDKKRMTDLINGWKRACDIAGVSWGGGETATMKQIVVPGAAEFGGSAIGIIKSKKNLIKDNKLKDKDRIILIKSNGVNANGISLTRVIAAKLPKKYSTRINGETYGELLLTRSNIYAKLIQDLQKSNIDIHYISNITGHGMRKIMRARPNFTYIIEKIFEPQEVFKFIQKQANLSDEEMYGTYNMGQDYAIFVPEKDVKKTLDIIKKNKFKGIDAGYIEKGPRQVIIKPKKIIFDGSRLDLR